jgi:glyoxylase-like metal-dependent hydrolase (beta-lactamase superfamily II)
MLLRGSIGARCITILGVAIGIAGIVNPLQAQANVYTSTLLETLRGLAHAVPGALPVSVRYSIVEEAPAVLSNSVEGAPPTKTDDVDPVFQVRYPAGWIIVDAGYTKGPNSSAKETFYQDRYVQAQDAIKQAGLIVVTHEHGDHTGGLLEPTLPASVAARTMLTREQVQTFMGKSMSGVPGFDSARANRYLVVDYDRVLPIGPGVVLIRAPGHTPGSQMVYVKLASGHELILIGDVVWNMAGIWLQHQKPDSTSRQMGEDRTTIGQQIAWLKNSVAPAAIPIVVSHDGAALQMLTKQGTLVEGLDLKNP